MTTRIFVARKGAILGTLLLATGTLGSACDEHSSSSSRTADSSAARPARLARQTLEPLEVAPQGPFEVGGPVGGPFDPPSRTFTLSNPGQRPTSWTATTDVPWLVLSSGAGTLPALGEQQVLATVDPAGLGPGHYDGTLLFRDTTIGHAAAKVPVKLGVGTIIENGAWLSVHGKPFFPIGVWSQPPHENWVIYYKSLGINTYLVSWPPPWNPGLLSRLEAHDMWAVLDFDPSSIHHPRVLGWLIPDEPDVTGRTPADVQQQYDAIKAADPDHLVAVNLTGNFYWDANIGSPSVEPVYQQYTDITEIVSFDYYPVTGWNQQTWTYMPGAMTGSMLDRYVDHQKPVWAILEASQQRLDRTPPGTPGPTPAQMRFEVWDSIIHGATAIHYFVSSFNPFDYSNLTPEIEQEMVRTNGQITDLTDVILSVPPVLAVGSSELHGRDHDFTLRRKGAVYYLLAVNADMGYNPATITFTFGQPIASVGVYGEGRSITPAGASFTDDFAPLEVHIYEIRF